MVDEAPMIPVLPPKSQPLHSPTSLCSLTASQHCTHNTYFVSPCLFFLRPAVDKIVPPPGSRCWPPRLPRHLLCMICDPLGTPCVSTYSGIVPPEQVCRWQEGWDPWQDKRGYCLLREVTWQAACWWRKLNQSQKDCLIESSVEQG